MFIEQFKNLLKEPFTLCDMRFIMFEIKESNTYDHNGKVTSSYGIKCLNIDNSLGRGEVDLLEIGVVDTKDFFEIIGPAILDDHEKEALQMIIKVERANQEEFLKNIKTVQSIAKGLKVTKSDVDLDIVSTQGKITSMLLKGITGTKRITKEEINTIGGAIHDVVAKYSEKELDDPEIRDKMKHEINYSIIEALPDGFVINSLNIDIDLIIKTMKEGNDNE
jgi:hypothetical protein